MTDQSQQARDAAEGKDWKDDPSADERWQAGLDFGMEQLCATLGVDPKSVMWDAATETLDGDVSSVIWNILRAKMGDDWDPHAPPPPPPKSAPEAMREAGIRLWNAAKAVALYRPLAKQICHVPSALMHELIDALIFSFPHPCRQSMGRYQHGKLLDLSIINI